MNIYMILRKPEVGEKVVLVTSLKKKKTQVGKFMKEKNISI